MATFICMIYPCPTQKGTLHDVKNSILDMHMDAKGKIEHILVSDI